MNTILFLFLFSAAVHMAIVVLAPPNMVVSRLRPALGRIILILLLVPSVLLLGVVGLILDVLRARMSIKGALLELYGFFKETWTALKGQGDV